MSVRRFRVIMRVRHLFLPMSDMALDGPATAPAVTCECTPRLFSVSDDFLYNNSIIINKDGQEFMTKPFLEEKCFLQGKYLEVKVLD